MYSELDADFFDALFRDMKGLISQWRTDLSSLSVRIANAVKIQKNLYVWH